MSDSVINPAGSDALKTPLIGLTAEQLRDVAVAAGAKPFAGKQIAKWIYERRATSIDAMTDLSLAVRERLKESYTVGRRDPIGKAVSTDGTVKYLFAGVGGRDIEAVYIPDRDRATLCVSSQAGCRMGCKFCMTGRYGLQGNLTAGDIINQVLSVDGSEELTNIVFMGMGEPLDNIDAVMTAIEILTASWGLAWSPKRITVSSIGRLKELARLLRETKVHIAISLHVPFSDERRRLMPVEAAYPITDVVALLRQEDWSHQRRLSFEYIMWRDVNDSLRYAAALAKLIGGMECRVNLIRFHAIPDSDLRPASRPTMEGFRDYLSARGITTTIRASRGEDIMAACGMLAGGADKPESANPAPFS